jgi:hypothetical protein
MKKREDERYRTVIFCTIHLLYLILHSHLSLFFIKQTKTKQTHFCIKSAAKTLYLKGLKGSTTEENKQIQYDQNKFGCNEFVLFFR